jgi:hypothetical protein
MDQKKKDSAAAITESAAASGKVKLEAYRVVRC